MAGAAMLLTYIMPKIMVSWSRSNFVSSFRFKSSLPTSSNSVLDFLTKYQERFVDFLFSLALDFAWIAILLRRSQAQMDPEAAAEISASQISMQKKMAALQSGNIGGFLSEANGGEKKTQGSKLS